MNKEFNEEALLNNVDLETQEEIELKPQKNELFWASDNYFTSTLWFIFILVLLYISPYIVPFLFSGSLDIYEYIAFDPNMFNNLKINLTNQERSSITQTMSKICNILTSPHATLQKFKPLSKSKFRYYDNLLPMNKISFIISSSTKSIYLCKLYVDIWSSTYGSNIVRNTEIEPIKTVYINSDKNSTFSNDNGFKLIQMDTKANLFDRLTFMLEHNIKSVPSDVEWFVVIDEKTLPLLDRIALMLSEYKWPKENSYFIKGPKNAESGFYLSRKMVESIVPKLKQCENHHFIKCVKSISQDNSPIIDHGLLKIDPKVIQGDLNGFIEGYASKFDLKSIRYVNEDYYHLFPKQFVNMMNSYKLFNVKFGSTEKNLSFDSFPISNGKNFFSQEFLFVNSAAASSDLFLKRYVIMFLKNDKYYCGILNFGYSLLIFDIDYKIDRYYELLNEIMKYFSGVEKTFRVLSDEMYYNLSRLLIPESKRLIRYYLKRTIQYRLGINAFLQEFCGVSSPSVMAKVYVNNKHLELDYLDYSIFR